MLAECPAHRGHAVPAAGHHIEYAGWEAGRLGQRGQSQGGQGRVLSRLHHAGAARSQGSGYLKCSDE